MSLFIVTTADDSGFGSLRQAIADAAATPGFDEIFFATHLVNSTIRLTSGPLAIAAGNDVAITAGGGGATGIVISGDTNNNGTADDGDTFLFDIAAGGIVTLDSLTLTNGFARGASAGYESGNPGGTVAGGIVNRGTLTLVDATLSGNAAIGGTGASSFASGQGNGGSAAGGVLNYGSLTMTGGAFAANDAAGGQGGYVYLTEATGKGGHAAGGILNFGGTVNLTDVGFDGTGSSVIGGYGGLAFSGSGPGGDAAGGILNFGTLTGSASGSGFTVLPGVYGGLTADLAMTIGTGGTDAVTGFQAPQTVYGLGGDDILKGAGGADSLFGGDGDDSLSLEDGHAVAGEVYDGGANADTLALYGNGTSDFDFRSSTVTSLETLAYASFFGGGATAHFLASQFPFTALALDNGAQVTAIDMSDATALDLSGLVITGAGDGDRFEISGDGDGEAITGGALPNLIAGNGGNDTLTGGAGNDTLSGGAGIDTLQGGDGDDTYIIDVREDRTVESSSAGGTDTIISSASRTLRAHFEHLALTGSAVTGNGNGLDNVITGNALNNRLRGDSGNDTLVGGNGDDELRGASGNDSMTGGLGNDRYLVDSLGDVVDESGAGAGNNDTVFSQIGYTLGANLENLILQTSADLAGTGNGSNNRIVGNKGVNLLQGLGGNDRLEGKDGADTLAGGAGNDTLTGGSQADVFRFAAANAGADRIEDFNKNADRFQLSGGSFSNANVVGADTILTHNGGTVRIAGVNNLALAQWNALVIPGGESGGGLGPLPFSLTEAASAQNLLIHLGGGDWFFA